MRAILLFGAALALLPSAALAETKTFTYDAKGRLIRVQVSNTYYPNGNVTYTFDKADNRTSRQVTGAP